MACARMCNWLPKANNSRGHASEADPSRGHQSGAHGHEVRSACAGISGSQGVNWQAKPGPCMDGMMWSIQ